MCNRKKHKHPKSKIHSRIPVKEGKAASVASSGTSNSDPQPVRTNPRKRRQAGNPPKSSIKQPLPSSHKRRKTMPSDLSNEEIGDEDEVDNNSKEAVSRNETPSVQASSRPEEPLSLRWKLAAAAASGGSPTKGRVGRARKRKEISKTQGTAPSKDGTQKESPLPKQGVESPKTKKTRTLSSDDLGPKGSMKKLESRRKTRGHVSSEAHLLVTCHANWP